MDRTRPGVLLSPLAILITANERGYAGKTGEAIQWDPSRALQHHLGVTKGYFFRCVLLFVFITNDFPTYIT